ncbi:T-cell immunoglobulin and mucin domain-containing protein 4-like isoform X2 [Acipenser ruthenus]|uniref:T-cell immunoglobulin and mucin domain-containing protein 4-like isoform X2 n=1 Tax=Acipenser ruthenus TaxID=7906 RepID=UPI0027411050|nr:T-cell immunoglobulin and mucin domain-containing protein 4-like isoform X2 [Acipenser ruthenus]
MKMLFSYDSLCWLLLVPMQVTFNSAQKVSGMLGQNVTVPCIYSVEGRVMEMCWGRGECPYSKCTQTIISSDGNRVNYKKSDKYGLFGNLQEGDVSLTILHPSEEDSGTYCCRMEIPGWFNDHRHNTQLIIEKAPATTTSKPVTARGADTVNTSKGQITTDKCLQKCQKLESKTIQELQIRTNVDENIYTTEEQTDYEVCP